MTTTNFSVPRTPLMEELLNDPNVVKDIARAYESIQRVISQTQQDIVREDNVDKIGPTVLGIKNVQDVFFVFKAKGDAIIEQESKTKP